MTVQQTLKSKREEIVRVAKQHGAYNVRVFGSVARGDADEKSDIDILVDLEKGRTLLDHAALSIELQQLLGCQVDVVTSRGLRERIRERVLLEAIPI